MNKNFIFLVCLLSSIFSSNLFAWKAGHYYHVVEAVKMVPEVDAKINRGLLEKMKTKYSLYIDGVPNFPTSMFDEKEMGVFNENSIYTPRDLHKPDALPIMFKFLVDSMKKEETEKMAFLISCISHHVNDSYSPHFDPAVYSVVDIFINMQKLSNLKGQRFELSKEIGISLLPVVKHKIFGKKRLEVRTTYKPKLINKKFDALAKYLKFLRYKRETARREYISGLYEPLTASLTDPDSEAASNATLKIYLTLYNLALLGNKETADIIHTAHEYAQNRYRIKLQKPNLYKTIQAASVMMKERKLVGKFGETIYKGLATQLNEPVADIGILVEPSYLNGEGCFGFSSKVMSAAMLSHLKKTDKIVSVIDLRSLTRNSLKEGHALFTIDPKKIPVLIVPAVKFQSCELVGISKRQLVRPLAKYIRGGGKILWVGSKPQRFFGPIAAKVLKSKTGSKLFEDENIKNSGLVLSTALSGDEDPVVELFVNSPFQKTSLHDVKSVVTIEQAEGVTPLIDCLNEDLETRETVAAAIDGRKVKKQLLFVAPYILFPHILTDRSKGLKTLQFDKKSNKIFQLLLEQFEI